MPETTEPPKIYFIKYQGLYVVIPHSETREHTHLASEFARAARNVPSSRGGVYQKDELWRVDGTVRRVSPIGGIICEGIDLVGIVDILYDAGWRVKDDLPVQAKNLLKDRLPRILHKETKGPSA
mgnify:CR=1 FL=1